LLVLFALNQQKLIAGKCIELPSALYLTVCRVCEAAECHVNSSQLELAVERLYETLDLLPIPREDWEAFTWICGTIADVFFMRHDFSKCDDWIRKIMISEAPGWNSNAFLHLRRGQCAFELGDVSKARQWLIGAYMLEGDAIFEGEDSKYQDTILDLIREELK